MTCRWSAVLAPSGNELRAGTPALHLPRKRPTRPAALAASAIPATTPCPLMASSTAAPMHGIAMAKPSHWPSFVSPTQVSSAVVSHPMRRFCSFSAMARMRSALPGGTRSQLAIHRGRGQGAGKRRRLHGRGANALRKLVENLVGKRFGSRIGGLPALRFLFTTFPLYEPDVSTA